MPESGRLASMRRIHGFECGIKRTERQVADLLSDFLNRPGGSTYLPLRRVVMASAEYDPQSTALVDFADLVATGRRDEVRAAVPGLMATHILSPRAHFLMAASARAAGDEAGAGREVAMAQALLHGIAGTGEGTAGAPYRCVHVSDEYDLAEARGLTVRTARQVVTDGRSHDVLTCGDGTEIWFDVTETIAAMAQN